MGFLPTRKCLLKLRTICLADQTRVNWQNRAQFFGVAAQLMRRILVDHARTHAAG